jgi:polysaccharide biosynthesis/export protein
MSWFSSWLSERVLPQVPTVVLSMAVLLFGASGYAAEPATAPTESASPAAPPATTPPPVAVDPDYIIGPGDTIQVFVWRNPELSVTVPVRPDGKISTPLVEDMGAVGKTSSQLARDIETVLAEYVRSPKVNIIVSQPMSAFNQVRVIGEVRTPQAVAYRHGLTALEVILQVGGLTEFAAGNRAKIVRKSADGKSTEIKVRLEALVKKGKMTENVDLKPGDVLIVPASIF